MVFYQIEFECSTGEYTVGGTDITQPDVAPHLFRTEEEAELYARQYMESPTDAVGYQILERRVFGE